MVTMPSARLRVAVVGQTCMQGGLAQCLQPTGMKPRARPDIRRSRCRAPGAIARPAASRWRAGRRPCRSGSPRSGAGPPPSPSASCAALPVPRRTATRTMSAPEPVASVSSSDMAASELRLALPKSLAIGRRPMVELADDEQRVRADALAHHRSSARRAVRCGDLDLVAVLDAELARGRGVDDDAAVAGTLSATSFMSCMPTLPPQRTACCARSAARADSPRARAARVAQRFVPQAGEVLPGGQRAVFLELRGPTTCMSCSCRRRPSSTPDALQPLLVGQLEAQPELVSVGVEVPAPAARTGASS